MASTKKLLQRELLEANERRQELENQIETIKKSGVSNLPFDNEQSSENSELKNINKTLILKLKKERQERSDEEGRLEKFYF